MNDVSSADVVIATTRSIRECHFDEAWLQDQIFRNPSLLGLGELEAIQKEKTQASGGRLDILLKDPDDDSMYEVELMLGETDETHIIRTIEYWDNERRRWPQRQHFAVLVAERVSRRFFNVVYLFGQNIPIIAIQANLVEVTGKLALVFTTILDVYEEPEDQLGGEGSMSEADWQKQSPQTLSASQRLLEIVKTEFPNAALSFGKISIAVKSDGKSIMLLYRRKKPQIFRLVFRVNEDKVEDIKELFDNIHAIPKNTRGTFRVTIDKAALDGDMPIFAKLVKLLKTSGADVQT